MPRIRTLDELRRLRAAIKDSRAERGRSMTVVNVSMATCSIAAGGQKALDAIRDEVARQQLDDLVEVVQSGCMTYCHSEPTVEITLPGGKPVVFGGVDEVRARALVSEYILQGEPVDGVIPVNYVRVAF
jgi:NADP-reducing hydrogenase subunit HndB